MLMFAIDCTNCDVRVVLVPSSSHAAGTWRPVYPSKQDYPRYIGNDRGDTYSPQQLDLSVLQNNDGMHDISCPSYANIRYIHANDGWACMCMGRW
jgi:hypothetical protein